MTSDRSNYPTTSRPVDVSIVIPTRNGFRYLRYAIESVLAQEARTFELVVSDNHSTDGTSEYLKTIADERFRVIRPDRLLSMVEHFEFALASARGEWVTTLGDDDGVMPFFFDNLTRLRLERVKANAIAFRRAYYFWEGVDELHGDMVVISFPYPRGFYKNNRWSMFLCLSSVIDYMHLPQTYTTGLVRRRYIEAIKAKANGVFFYGKAPDAASAVALLLHAKRHYRVEEPVFWTGTSPKSTGFSQASQEHKQRSDEFDRLNEVAKRPPTRDLPQPLASEFDFAVIFFEALMSNPCTGRLWTSAAMRCFFFAGLVMKDPKYSLVLKESYGPSFKPWILPPFIGMLRFLKRRHDRAGDKMHVADRSLTILSSDRAAYPTMREASVAVLARWHRLRAQGR